MNLFASLLEKFDLRFPKTVYYKNFKLYPGFKLIDWDTGACHIWSGRRWIFWMQLSPQDKAYLSNAFKKRKNQNNIAAFFQRFFLFFNTSQKNN